MKCDITWLETGKVDTTVFKKTVRKLECKDLAMDIKLFKNSNHAISMDNYLEKYAPIRTQALIDETLRAVLSGKERRRLELYDAEKNAILYRSLIADDGSGKIAEMMRDLHTKAAAEIALAE